MSEKLHRKIELGEEFFPFAEESLKKIIWQEGVYEDKFSEVSLYLNKERKGKMDMVFGSYFGFLDAHYSGFSPFDPERGYTVDQRDFSLESRLEKIGEAISKKENGKLKGFNNFRVFHNRVDFERLRHGRNGFFNKIKDLKLQVYFPFGSYEAGVTDVGNVGWYHFTDFYPVDLGPLPTERGLKLGIHKIEEGLPIYLPTSVKELQEVRAKFVFP